MNIAVFVSGRGSNMKAILDSEELRNKVKVSLVVSDKTDCKAFDTAEEYGIETVTVSAKEKKRCVSYSGLMDILESKNIELIVLAGFLKLIPVELVRKYKYKIINIHPALLPSFGGKGMYGMNVHKAVFESGAKVSGPTIHFIDEEYDKGWIIAQKAVDISDVTSPEEIAERVLNEEHKLLPFITGKMADGKITITDNRTYIEN